MLIGIQGIALFTLDACLQLCTQSSEELDEADAIILHVVEELVGNGSGILPVLPIALAYPDFVTMFSQSRKKKRPFMEQKKWINDEK